MTWITSISPDTGSDNQQITITYEENTAITTREAILTLAATELGATETVRITLTQAAVARELSADKTDIPITVDAGDITFEVTANLPWAITKRPADTFITDISPDTGSDNKQITITYDENTASTSRKAILTLSATDGGGETRTITLTQAAVARELSADKTRITVTPDAGRATFNVTANVDWAITKRNTDDWITSISPETGSANQEITITYEENTAITTREAVLTLAATDGGGEAVADGSETTQITLTQTGDPLAVPTLANSLRFYPNPASHTLYIEGISQETALFIRTLAGKTLLRATLHQNQAVDIAALPQGTYLLTLQSGQENAQEQSQEQSQEQRTGRLLIGL